MKEKILYRKPLVTNLGNLKKITLKSGSAVDTDNKGNVIGTKPGQGGV